MAVILWGFALLLGYPFFAVFIRPFFSPHRHLPCAKQRFLLLRLLHEPSTFETSEWMRAMPENGLIRYFGFLNQERILLTDTDIIRQVLLRDALKYDKLPSLAALQIPAGVSGLVSAKGQLHKFHRRHTIAAFTGSVARKLYPTIWQSVRHCTTYFAEQVSQSPSGLLKINSFMQAACLDIAGPANLGLDFNILSHPERELTKAYLKPFQFGKQAPLYLKLLQIPPTSLQPFLTAIVKTVIFRIDISAMHSLIRKTLHMRLNAVKDEELMSSKIEEQRTPDVLDELIRRAHHQISERALLRHTMTTVAASLEMVSNELSWAIYALSRPENQYIQDRLRNEIRNRFLCPPEMITWEDINSLPYLIGVVNEILRLYPGVAHRSRVCNTATTLLGQDIPRGTILTYPIYASNRNPALWGVDSDVFRPERWFEPDNRDTYAFMTFGQGPRKCPGEHYTRAVIACMLFSFVGRFRFKIPKDGVDVMEHDGAKGVKFGIVMKADIYSEVEEVPGWEKADSTGTV